MRWTEVFILAALALGLVAPKPSEPFPIELEFAAAERSDDSILTLLGMDQEAGKLPWLSASTILWDSGEGDELIRILHKPAGRDSRIFRYFFFRNGELGALYEYRWDTPAGSHAFRKTAERRFRFEKGEIVAGRARLGRLRAEAVRAEAARFYQLVKQRRAEIAARRKM